jgi:hypothetical protein
MKAANTFISSDCVGGKVEEPESDGHGSLASSRQDLWDRRGRLSHSSLKGR